MLDAQLKETVDSMDKKDLVHLEAYLKVRNLVDDDDFKNTSTKRLAEMKSGQALSSTELKELDQTLRDRGL